MSEFPGGDEDDWADWHYEQNKQHYKKPRLFSPVGDGCFGQIVVWFLCPTILAITWWLT